MNRKILILLTLAAAGSLGLRAQRLSPLTQSLIYNLESQATQPMSQHSPSLRSVGADASSVRVFVTYSDADVLTAIERLGGQVHTSFANTVTASLPVSALAELGSTPGVEFVEVGVAVNTLCEQGKKLSEVADVHSGKDLPAAFTGRGVVVGLVDIGMEYNHMAFRDESGQKLRLSRVWNQSAVTGRAPAKFGYGVEYTQEDEIIGASYDTASGYHATHVANIAAGSDPGTKNSGMAPGAELVFVNFATNATDVVNGIQYIFDYADEVGKPCVINLSLGAHMGPHDGTSVIDRFIDQAVGPGRIIVGAVGNEGEALMHIHKQFTEGDTEVKTMLSFTDSSAKAQSAADIWGDAGSDFTVTVGVADPLKGRIIAESKEFLPSQKGPDFALFRYDQCGAEVTFRVYGVQNDQNRPNIYMEIYCEEMSGNRKPFIRVNGQEGHEVHLWNVGAQSFTSAGRNGWTEGDAECSVGEIGGTANRIIAVGAYNSRRSVRPLGSTSITVFDFFNTKEISSFSSHGPTADGRLKPDVVAPGMMVVSAVNQHDQVSFSPSGCVDCTYDSKGRAYYYGIDAGTSMASPFVTGTVALWLEAFPELTPEQAKEALHASATVDKYCGDEVPNNVAGYGKLNSYKGIKYLVQQASLGQIDAAPATDGLCRVWAEGSEAKCASAISGTAAVYTTSGTLLRHWAITEGLNTLSLPARAIYIVALPDGSTAKLAL